jgi:integrase/recombinase XerD
MFRHSMATHMLEGGASLRYIQEMLGHAQVETTEIYTRVSPEALRSVVLKTHPGAELLHDK